MNKEKYYAYIGTYTFKGSKGLYLAELDLEGHIRIVRDIPIDNPSYLYIDKVRYKLYAVVEGETFQGQYGGGVVCFQINDDGGLTLCAQLSTGGTYPCHLKTSEDDSYLFVANYGEGTTVVYDLDWNGVPVKVNKTIVHEGLGADKDRQEKAHIHFAANTPGGRYLCVVDLGTDSIVLYDQVNDFKKVYTFHTDPGAGPRQIKFHNGYGYILTELTSQIYVVKTYLGDDPRFDLIQTITALPSDNSVRHAAAELKMLENGRLLFASIRFENGIAIYRIQENGFLSMTDFVRLEGDCPRYFCFSPDGQYLYALLQDIDKIVTYKIDYEKGTLINTGSSCDVPTPVCMRFL